MCSHRYRRPLFGILGSGVCLLAALWLGFAQAESPQDVDSNRSSLLLIVVDTLRVDHLGYAGYGRPTSPVIDTFVASAVNYRAATTQATWTVPSMATLMCSVYPFNHRMQFGPGDTGDWHGLAAELHPLAEVLGDRGFKTAALVGNPILRPKLGLDRGFDRYEQMSDEKVVAEAARQLARWGDERSFLYLHLLGPHPSLDPPAPFGTMFGQPADEIPPGGLSYQHVRAQSGSRRAAYERWYRDLYDADIRYTDKLLGDLLAYLDVTGRLEDTVVVLTSDHGEHLFDHGYLGHGMSVYEPLAHVPLAIHVPGQPAGTVDEIVELVDLAPTLLDALDVPQPRAWNWDGQVIGGDASDGLAFCEQGTRQSVRDQRYKLIVDRSTGVETLYDLAEDPGETRDAGVVQPAIRDGLWKQLRRWRTLERAGAMPSTPLHLDEADLERLRALGYVE